MSKTSSQEIERLPFQRVGIAGAGTMGSGIALTALYAGLRVTLFDISQEILDQAYEYIEHHLNRKRMAINIKYLTLTRELEALRGSQIVVEAIPEKLALKMELFAKLDVICPPPTILASNTSTLSITSLAAEVEKPGRVAGMHFFNPAPVLPLVEVVKGAQTSQETVDRIVQFSKKLGKTPVVTKDTPGFIVNRVARPFYGEALRLLGEGVGSHAEIDRIVERGAGFKMGPFRLMDLIGIDVNFAATQSIFEQTFFEPRYRPHLIQAQMVNQKALGRKAGRGFYDYTQEGEAKETNSHSSSSAGNWRVYLSAGSWAPELDEKCRLTGFEVLRFPDDLEDLPEDRQQIGVVVSGESEGIKKHVQEMDESLPADIPLLCQGADVVLSEIATWIQYPQRLAVFDGLFLRYGDLVTLSASPSLETEIKNKIDTFFHDLRYDVVWVDESPGLILPRIVFALVNEAAFAIGEQVTNGDMIDTAMKLGTSYPRGPIEWGNEVGFDKIVTVMDHLQAEYREARYRSAPLLRKWARRKIAS